MNESTTTNDSDVKKRRGNVPVVRRRPRGAGNIKESVVVTAIGKAIAENPTGLHMTALWHGTGRITNLYRFKTILESWSEDPIRLFQKTQLRGVDYWLFASTMMGSSMRETFRSVGTDQDAFHKMEVLCHPGLL